MRERPILFSAPMVRALLDGKKTQTRRVIKPQPDVSIGWGGCTRLMFKSRNGADILNEAIESPEPHSYLALCPHGTIGDRLWVREAWRVGKPHDNTAPRNILPPLIERGQGVTVLYEAGGWRSIGPDGRPEPTYPDNELMPNWAGKARPSMFMPRAFSRITLEITSVRVERLQDIGDEDAIAEGIEGATEGYHVDGGRHFHAASPRYSFASLWDSLNAERGHGWDINPWVWVVEFKRV